MSETIKVDAIGELCPIPVVKAKKTMDLAAPGDTIEVHVDNEIAVQNLLKLAKSQNSTGASEQVGPKHFVVRIPVNAQAQEQLPPATALPGTAVAQPQQLQQSPQLGGSGGQVVVLGSNLMGNGDEALGKILIKGFLYAVSQMEVLPTKILCYNSGVFLTTEDSDSIKDLQYMEGQGVEIYSCGTCLDYYKRKDELKVGGVSNMYEIVEAMSQAGQILRP